jgi:hypothetical protein
MPYTALPDRRMPYDNDGTIVGYRGSDFGGSYSVVANKGIVGYISGAPLIELNDDDFVSPGSYLLGGDLNVRCVGWWFFPEQREITAWAWGITTGSASFLIPASYDADTLQGSNDSTNGVDGTWETASLPSGKGGSILSLDGWRSIIKPISFTGTKQVFRPGWIQIGGGTTPTMNVCTVHLYGEKGAGQTPDDIIYINHDDTPGVEYTIPEDFGDQPFGTTVVRQFRIKNVSGSKTANTINIQCNDSDFAISEDGVNWVVTINITSLSAGAESSTMYVRCTTPAPGGVLGPRFARIVTTVASYT